MRSIELPAVISPGPLTAACTLERGGGKGYKGCKRCKGERMIKCIRYKGYTKR